MATATASQVKQNFGRYIDEAQSEPVRVQKHGRDSVVMISAKQYAALVENQRSFRAGDLDAKTVHEITSSPIPSHLAELNHLMDD